MFLRSVATALAMTLAVPAVAQEAAPEPLPDIAMGAEDAPLTIIEYASFTCGHCANFHNDVFPELKSEYIDTGTLGGHRYPSDVSEYIDAGTNHYSSTTPDTSTSTDPSTYTNTISTATYGDASTNRDTSAAREDFQ